MSHHLSRGGDGSHWEGCHESHWDCRLAWLERENERMREALLTLGQHQVETSRHYCRQCEQLVDIALEDAEAGKRILRRQRKWQFDALRAVRTENELLFEVVSEALVLRRCARQGLVPPAVSLAAFDAAMRALGERADEGGAAPASVRTGFAE